MKLGLIELIHRFIFLVVAIVFTVAFFLLLETLQSNVDRLTVLATGIIGFVFLGVYDVKKFNGKWW